MHSTVSNTNGFLDNLFLVSGRIEGDDDDTVHIIESPDLTGIEDRFAAELRGDSDDHESEVYIISSQPLSGAIANRLQIERGGSNPHDANLPVEHEAQEPGLDSVTCKLLGPDVLGVEVDQVSMILAALRHLQGAIEAGEDLSYLGDIVDPASLNHEDIDALCEVINVG